MADNVTVSNAPASSNPDIPVRTLDKSGEQVQVMAIDYGGAGAEDLTVPDFATETTLASINTSLAGGITANIATDILGVSVSGTRNNEIEVSFFDSFDSDIVTITTADGGSAVIADGHARFRSGTSATGSVSAESVFPCKYRPANEQYCYFTAAFTAPDANAVQRIGLFDTNNGFFIGYEGTSFGITRRSNATDYTTARASWNGDPLDGSGSSTFTRAGIPEAINFEYQNLFRIRYAWLGSAPVKFEVLSPDEAWVCFHTIKAPNLTLVPSIEIPNLPCRIEVVKTSGSADVSIYSGCIAAGTTSFYYPITETLNSTSLATLSRSVITGETTAGGGGFVNVKVNPSGSLTTALGDIDGVVGQDTMANSLPVAIASDQSTIPVSVVEPVGKYDIFGKTIVTSLNNDVDVQFYRGAPETLVAVTTANSGTAVSNVGGALFSSSTDANGSAIGVSRELVAYSSGTEIYCLFTAAFSPGIASSYMRLGLYDANNGFFIGYEGTSFGVTTRNNAVDVSVPKASWSEDTLTGGAGSLFTRAGVPEAIDLTKLNVFRVRFGWLGSAPALWEVMAPDGHWVTFHKILYPNLQTTPSIRNADLPMTLDITKTGAAATNLTIQTDCWGAGTTSVVNDQQSDRYAFQTSENLAGGATYSSGILSLSPAYSQVQTTVLASRSGTLNIYWYSDAGGADLLRTLTIPYTSAQGFQMFAAPAFTRYVKYEFTNAAGAAQTDFYFDTKFLRKPLSAQILRVDGTIADGMFATLHRSIISGETSGGGGGYVNVKVTPSGTLETNASQSGTWNIATVSTLPDAVAATYSSSSVTSVTSSASSTTVLASNASRRMAIMVNDTDKNAYVKFGATASTTSYSYKLAPGQTLEFPSPMYTGIVDAIWDSSPTGSMRVTEIT